MSSSDFVLQLQLSAPLLVHRAGGFLIREASVCLERSSIRVGG
jgi:hypothetical protein